MVHAFPHKASAGRISWSDENKGPKFNYMIKSESAFSVLLVSGSWLLGYWEMSRNPTSSLLSVLLREATFLNAVFYHEFTIFSQNSGANIAYYFTISKFCRSFLL